MSCSCAVGVLLVLARGQTPAQSPRSLEQLFAERVESRRGALVVLRRDIHRHPEVSGEERRTAAVVADRLRELGLEVRTGVGGHGVVGTLRGARPGPVAAFRADMDAVLSDAPDPVEFRSLEPGKRHICGHDVHTTIGLALAEGFAALRAELPGTLVLLFQPAEEDGTGARAMLADGALDDPRPAAIFALHTSPFEVGELATSERALLAGRDRVILTITGTGELEAVARELREQLAALSMLTLEQALQPSPVDAIFVQAGIEHGPDGSRLVVGSISTASPEARAEARVAVEQLVAELARPDAAIQLAYEERWLAGVTNDTALVRSACASARTALEKDIILLEDVVPAFSEDFGSFQDVVPGVMFFLGVSNTPRGIAGMPHTPDYVADEEAIFVGARAMAAVLLDFLRSG